MLNKWCLSFTRKIGFVLFFLIIYSSGFYFIQKQAELVICKYQFKKNILKDISENELIAFKVSKDYDKDEFEVDNTWYDVVKSKSLQDYKIVYCVKDSDESEIHKELSIFVENWYQDKFNNLPNHNSFYKFLINSKYLNENLNFEVLSLYFSEDSNNFPALFFHLQNYFVSNFKPPVLTF